jgi:hypothetical protein
VHTYMHVGWSIWVEQLIDELRVWLEGAIKQFKSCSWNKKYVLSFIRLKLGSISQKITVNFAISDIVFKKTTRCNFKTPEPCSSSSCCWSQKLNFFHDSISVLVLILCTRSAANWNNLSRCVFREKRNRFVRFVFLTHLAAHLITNMFAIK